jgi:hypothetical protein
MTIDWDKLRRNPLSREASHAPSDVHVELARRVCSELPLWGVAEDIDLTIFRVGACEGCILNETRNGSVLWYVDFTPGAEVVFSVRNRLLVENMTDRVRIEVEQVAIDSALGIDDSDRIALSAQSQVALSAVTVEAIEAGAVNLQEAVQVIRQLAHDSRGGITREIDGRIFGLARAIIDSRRAVDSDFRALVQRFKHVARMASHDGSETSDALIAAVIVAISCGDMTLTTNGIGKFYAAIDSVSAGIIERARDDS